MVTRVPVECPPPVPDKEMEQKLKIHRMAMMMESLESASEKRAPNQTAKSRNTKISSSRDPL